MDVVSDSNSKVSCNWVIKKLTASLDGHVLFFYQRDNISCEHGKERMSRLSLIPLNVFFTKHIDKNTLEVLGGEVELCL